MSAQGGRKARVAQAMRDVLAEMLDREVRDPRVKSAGIASVNHVELNADMSVAKVYISFFGPAESDERCRAQAMTGLEGAAGYLRGPLSRRLGLRRAPTLRFVHDDSPIFSQRIAELVRSEGSSSEGNAGPDTGTESGPERGPGPGNDRPGEQ